MTSRKALQSFKARLSQSFLSQVALQSCLVSFGGSFMGMGLLFYFCSLYIYMMIPGEKGQKCDASVLAGGFLTLDPAQNMSKKPFFEEK